MRCAELDLPMQVPICCCDQILGRFGYSNSSPTDLHLKAGLAVSSCPAGTLMSRQFDQTGLPVSRSSGLYSAGISFTKSV